jgi:DNA-directed RNA polymerase subunit D
MKCTIIDKDKENASFVLEGINEAIANTIRRFSISYVPTLAIEDITIQKNNSALYDEVLAHRLGLIPLKTDLKSYKQQEECSCKGKGCSQCTLVLSLKAKGPCTVYAENIESKDPKVKPVFNKMIITKLLKNQELKLEAKAILSRGKNHMKFSPGLVYYRGQPIITIKNKNNVKKVIEATHNNLLEKENHLVIKDIKKWTDADEEVCEKNNMDVQSSKENFIFHVESWGQLTPKEILTTAVNLFDQKLDEFSQAFKKL